MDNVIWRSTSLIAVMRRGEEIQSMTPYIDRLKPAPACPGIRYAFCSENRSGLIALLLHFDCFIVHIN